MSDNMPNPPVFHFPYHLHQHGCFLYKSQNFSVCHSISHLTLSIRLHDHMPNASSFLKAAFVELEVYEFDVTSQLIWLA